MAEALPAADGLILAGGQGRRVNEADKGLLPWRGRVLVEQVAARLAPQVHRLIISANRNAARYAAYGEVVGDATDWGDWPGPLGGLAAGLAACRQPWLVCVPCDTPLIPQDLAARLIGSASAAGAALAVAASQGRRHAVCMALRVTLLDNLRACLDAGERKVGRWQDQAGAVEVAFDDMPTAFLNLNTLADFS